jgi:5-methylcytosine-specific restriction protein A
MIFDEVILDDLDDELTTPVSTMSQIICTRQKYCVWCGTAGTSQNKLQVDHILPLSKSGTHDLENLRILCQNCHKKRQGVHHR